MIRAAVLMCIPVAGFADPTFENLSANLPMHVYDGGWEHFVGGGIAVFDCNGDMLPDVFAAGGENPAKLIVNEGNFVFRDAVIPALTGVTGAYPIDIDADGHLDLFVLRVGPNVVLRGMGSCQFSDANDKWLIPRGDNWTTAFTPWWEDDGLPVMALGNYVDRTDPDGPFEACDDNHILRPTPEIRRPDNDGRIVEFATIMATGAYSDSVNIAYSSQTLTPGFCPLSILAARDARGVPALRLSNDRHYYVNDGYEQMWDIREGRFLGPDDGWNNVSLWGMGIATRDLTGDGRDEVMLTSMGDQLLQIAGENGAYVAAPYEIGSYAQRPHIGDDGRPSTGWHAEFGDVDNDGRADLFIAKGNVDQMPGMAMLDPNNLLMQAEDGTFFETAEAAGVATLDRSRGAALVDFDLDGRLDLIVSNRRAPLELYRNTTPDTGNWITVSIHQQGGNRDAIGAVITVDAGPLRQSIQQTIGGGHAGGQLLPRHFGLGDARDVEVTVEWPDGTMMTTQAVAGDRVRIMKP